MEEEREREHEKDSRKQNVGNKVKTRKEGKKRQPKIRDTGGKGDEGEGEREDQRASQE